MSVLVEAEGRLHTPAAIRQYIIGGHATFTVVFDESVGRRTFKVQSWKKNYDANWSTGNQNKDSYWVSLKTGPGDSFQDYQNIGVLKRNLINGDYRFEPKKNKDGQMQAGAALFDGIWNPLEQGCTWNQTYEFWHEGRCCICGRKLTVPESVASGIGPECASKGGM